MNASNLLKAAAGAAMGPVGKIAGSIAKTKKKLQPGKAYKVARPAKASSVANKMKNMAASCQACGK